MTHTSLTPHPLSFKLGLGFWNALSPQLSLPLIDKFIMQGRRALDESDIVAPDAEHLRLIVMAATESVCLLHDTALNPTQEDLDHHFADFVVRAVTGSLDK